MNADIERADNVDAVFSASDRNLDADEWGIEEHVAFRTREPLHRPVPALRRSRSELPRSLRPKRSLKHRGRERSKTMSMERRSALILRDLDRGQKGYAPHSAVSTVSAAVDDRVGDEWMECGDVLEIMPSERQRISIPLHCAMRRLSGHRGSAFAARSVCRGVHFWKIKVFCSAQSDCGDALGFAMGFVPVRGGANQRNGSFLKMAGSVGISGGHSVWSDGKKVSITKGIAMRRWDIVNLMLDLDRSRVLVQRVEYRRSTKEYQVHCARKLAVRRKVIESGRGGGYRLGCHLEQKGQSMLIMDYHTEPFEEWIM